jgi:hypothetical protein
MIIIETILNNLFLLINKNNLPDFIIQFLNFMPNNVLRQISSITTISIFLFTCEVSIINLHSMIIYYRYI